MNLAQVDETYQLRNERLNFFPENYKKESKIDSTASELNPFERFFLFPFSKVPKWVFSASGIVVKSRKAVTLNIFRSGTLYFVENENLNIYATGESLKEAMRAFNDHLIYFYNHYKKLSWSRVTGEARRLKKLYDELFQVTSI